LSGKVYALNHLKFENDFAAGSFPSSLRKTWLSTVYSMRPVRLQGEYANSTLDNVHLLAGAQKDSTIQAYYVQGSWFVTGEKRFIEKIAEPLASPSQSASGERWSWRFGTMWRKTWIRT